MWGEVTASVDWCEENYSTFFGLAEFYNTLTNIPFIIGAYLGVLLVQKQGLELRFAVSYVMLGVVGLGSILFHGTLLRSFQVLDEVPMVLTTCWMAYNSFLYRGREHLEFTSFKFIMVVGSIFVYLAYFLFMYFKHYNDPVVFQLIYTAFAILMICQRLRVTWSLKKELPNLTQESFNQAKYVMMLGLTSYIGASVFWGIDHHACEFLKDLRATLDKSEWLWLCAPLLQFHGWWHIFAALGTFLEVGSSIYVRYLYKSKKAPSLRYLFAFFPVVVIDESHSKYE
jgi:dihydroceramidase